MFLEQTLFLTPKSNKWLPVLMKYAKDDNCKKTKSGHWPSEEHFGTWVAGAIISNLSDKEYAKELGIFHGGILQEEYLRAKNKSDGCDWGRRIHKILMARLEQDYKAGKLNFE